MIIQDFSKQLDTIILFFQNDIRNMSFLGIYLKCKIVLKFVHSIFLGEIVNYLNQNF